MMTNLTSMRKRSEGGGGFTRVTIIVKEDSTCRMKENTPHVEGASPVQIPSGKHIESTSFDSWEDQTESVEYIEERGFKK
jgi:hypothetical protein